VEEGQSPRPGAAPSDISRRGESLLPRPFAKLRQHPTFDEMRATGSVTPATFDFPCCDLYVHDDVQASAQHFLSLHNIIEVQRERERERERERDMWLFRSLCPIPFLTLFSDFIDLSAGFDQRETRKWLSFVSTRTGISLACSPDIEYLVSLFSDLRSVCKF
jgi:hypothetical protein